MSEPNNTVRHAKDSEYTAENFPYARVLWEISDWGSAHYIHPVEAYEKFLKLCAKYDLLPCPDYFSTSVTSGGVARIVGVSYEEAVKRNSKISYKTMESLALAGAIDPKRSLLPTDISANHLLKDWQQKDYITFWHLVISGVRPNNFRRLRKTLDKAYKDKNVNIDLINDSKVVASARAPQHYRLTSAVVEAIDSVSGGRRLPVNRVISLNDTDRSLGCRAERDLAGRLHIPSCDIQLGQGIEDDKSWINFLGDLADDVLAVIKSGGRLSLLRPGDTFSIIYVPEIFGETDTHLRMTDLRDLGEIEKTLRSSGRCTTANAKKIFTKANLRTHLNPFTSKTLSMSIHNSDGVNGALIENGQTDFVSRDIASTVETLQLVIKPARRRKNQPPIVVPVRKGDINTERAMMLAGLQPIGGNLWSLS
jgi:hypothetical protein